MVNYTDYKSYKTTSGLQILKSGANQIISKYESGVMDNVTGDTVTKDTTNAAKDGKNVFSIVNKVN